LLPFQTHPVSECAADVLAAQSWSRLLPSPFTDINSTVVTIDNLIVQPVPTPAALPLFATGLGLLGWRGKA
jgi:hypothetical protein